MCNINDFTINKNEVIKFRDKLSEFVSTILDLEKKRLEKGFLSAADNNLLNSKRNDFSASSNSLFCELIGELLTDADNSRLLNILQHELQKLADAMQAKDAKRVKKISDDLVSQLNTVINDGQSPYNTSAVKRRPSSTVFIPPILAGLFLGCVLSKNELYDCCCTLGKVFTGFTV